MAAAADAAKAHREGRPAPVPAGSIADPPAKGSPLANATEKAADSTAKKQTKPKPTKRTGATSSSSKKGASASRARKARAKSAGRKATRLGRTATAAGAGRSASFVGLLVLSLGLVLLYNLLAGAEQLAGFLGGIQRAIAWLVSPTATIPFKEQ